VYIIEGYLKCAERVDIGEHIYRYCVWARALDCYMVERACF
jgi:hypothetical protein